MGHYQDELYEAATELLERFIEQFIDDHGREPTEEEILAAEHDAYIDYVSGLADSYYDQMKDEHYE